MPEPNENIVAEIQRLHRAGVQVAPLTEAPADIQAMAAEDFAFLDAHKRPGRTATPVWRVVGGGAFEFSDGEFGCHIPDVRADVFLAFGAQMNAYEDAAGAGDNDRAFVALARAFALLKHRKRWWERWVFRRAYFVNDAKAKLRLIREVPARAIYTFIPVALAGYYNWVIGKKKSGGPVNAEPESPDTARV